MRVADLLSRPRARQLARVVATDTALVAAWLAFFLVGHPNQVGMDPDVAAGFFVSTAAEAGPRRGAARWLTRRQAYLFFPMLLLEGLNLHVEGVRDLARRRRQGRERGRRPDRAATTEAALLLVHTAACLAAVAAVLPPGKAIVFVAVHQALFGLYMGCAFAPNHKGMPVSTRSEPDYLRRQVLTSRNIRGGPWTDVVFGYQVDSVAGSYRQALRHLHSVSAPLRHPAPQPRTRTGTGTGTGHTGTGTASGAVGARE